MSHYIPLALKYRPQHFSDVIGQDITVKILMNGISKQRLGSAILFSGTRGVGKTTLARILAKVFRCENLDLNSPEPCCKCSSCLSFTNYSQMDIIEIDAASNTSVDDMREIIESCRYKPTSGAFKVFIIDEVHMLSKSAFNALLKTLEEPPEHVKFLFATTETYKIPETVLSRVMQFNLKKLTEPVIAQYLSFICNKEGIASDIKSLALLAKAANGSVRDGLSILDQAINISAGALKFDDVRCMLNIASDEDIIDLLDVVISGDSKLAVEKYRNIVLAEVSCINLVNKLINFVHIVICSKLNISIEGMEFNESILGNILCFAAKTDIPTLTKIWQMLLKALEEIKISENPYIVFEIILIRIIFASKLPKLDELLINLENLKHLHVNNSDISFDHMCVTPSIGEKISLLDEAINAFPNSIIENKKG